MIDKKEIEAFVEEGLTGSDCFVVDVQVKPDNVIVVEIDNEEGVDIDRCVALHRFLESKLDRDVEDYELEVGVGRDYLSVQSPRAVQEKYRQGSGIVDQKRHETFGDIEKCRFGEICRDDNQESKERNQ